MLKVQQPAILQPLEAHEQVVPFWKPPISHCLEPGVHGNSRAIIAQNSHSKMGQYSDPWGGVISKYRPIFEKFWSNTYRRPKAGGMY